jgi:hypothetical protein
MDDKAINEAIENYQFSLQSLRRIATRDMPDNIPDFLALLALQASHEIRGEAFQRQQEDTQRKEYRSE